MSEGRLIDGRTGELVGGGYNASNGYTSSNQYVANTNSTYVPQEQYSTSYRTGSGVGQTVVQSGYGAGQTGSYGAGQVVGSTYGTGQAIGTAYGQSGYTQQNVVTTTTTTGYPAGQYAVGGSTYQGGASSYQTGGVVGTAQVVNTTVNTGKEVIKGESRIEYVPFEKKVVDYKTESYVERVPKKRIVTEYKEERKIETVPREVTVTDYYAVEYLRQYIPQYVPEKRIEYVQVPKKQVRYEYIPVERQIVHYPDQPLEAERTAGYAHTHTQQTTYVQPTTQVVTTQQYVQPASSTYVAQGTTQYVGGQSGAQYVQGGSSAQYVQGGSSAQYVQGGSSGQYVQGGSTYAPVSTNQVVYDTYNTTGGAGYTTHSGVPEYAYESVGNTAGYATGGNQYENTVYNYSRDQYLR